MGYRSTNTIFITSGPVEVGLQAPELGAGALPLGGQSVLKKVVAVAGRTSMGLVGSLAGARRAPQSGVLPLSLLTLVENGVTTFSGSFTHITITRDYRLATDEDPIGFVHFTPSEWMVNNRVTIPTAKVSAVLSSEGQIAISLAANTDPGTTPSDSYYTVREEIVGQPTRSYKVAVPYNEGVSVDLSSLPVIP